MAYSDGKCAVITGAGSGIGRALALHLNRDGCALCISDINRETLAETAASLQRPELACDQQVLDVADRAAVHAWADRIAAERGCADIVINNAGVGLAARVEDMSYDDLDWLMGVNFWGVIHGSMAFLPLLKRAPQGHLVNISSLFGMIAVPTQSAYNAAKFGVRGFTESLRQEMAGSNVHVCCVHPGGIATNIARDSRGGDTTPEERHERFHSFARTSPESAAARIAHAIEKRKPRLMLGADSKIASLVAQLFPVRYPSILGLGKLTADVGGKS
jgi:NAD(P)-dependent dehydrogenase (short-subunit alcohol dehydrogenase family)